MNYIKGHKFEKYALDLFKPEQWEIENIAADLSSDIERKVKSDSDPDIIVKNKSKNLKFALECKYHSNFLINKKNGSKGLYWAKDYNIEKYQKFQEENGFPVYILIGVNGLPSRPERTFLLNLKTLKYSWVGENYLQQFVRKVGEPFRLENNYLK